MIGQFARRLAHDPRFRRLSTQPQGWHNIRSQVDCQDVHHIECQRDAGSSHRVQDERDCFRGITGEDIGCEALDIFVNRPAFFDGVDD